MREQGIGVNLHYIPVYKQPYYKSMGFKTDNFPEAERYYSDAISLPMYPAMSEDEQDVVISKLNRAFQL
jgi:dTDP-4-amino-4,6-dideoxygalactose transaminase